MSMRLNVAQDPSPRWTPQIPGSMIIWPWLDGAARYHSVETQGLLLSSSRLQLGTYVSVLAYTTPSCSFETAVNRFRMVLMGRHRLATTFGYGPRYLHSTGQLHKGGPNTGIFLELVDRMTPDVPIPGKPFSFGTLAQAQAAGDMESLSTHHRHAVRVQLGRDQAATVNAITAALIETASSGRRTASKKRRQIARR